MNFSIKFQNSKRQVNAKRRTKRKSETTTVDAKHREFMNKFEQQRSQGLTQLQKQQSQKEKQLKRLEKKKSKEPVEFQMIAKLKKELKQINEQIKRIESNKDEEQYLLNTVETLKLYHDAKIGALKEESQASDPSDITNYFGGSDSIATEGKITSYIEIKAKNERNKGEILDEYLRNADPTYISKKVAKKNRESGCKCGSQALVVYDYHSGTNVCERCGTVLVHFFDHSFTSYKESQDHDAPVDFPYDRLNHFNELIAQFQAKEQTDIPEQVFEKLEKAFETERVDDYDTLTYNFVKKQLKQLGMVNMYEHIPYIIYKFNGQPPPVLTLEQEQKFRKMFKQIQGPFERCKHLAKKDRKNFLRYSYVFYKFAELLELDHLLKYFRLLQSREKLFLQDKVWKAICGIMEWEFIPSL